MGKRKPTPSTRSAVLAAIAAITTAVTTAGPVLSVALPVAGTASPASALPATAPLATASLATARPATARPATAPQATATTTIPVQLTGVSTAGSRVASTARGLALRRALGKLGAPYRWGAAGPSAFDCSGLVSWAFRQAGVTLPRTSRGMSTIGMPVGRSDLRPGDLVFFYRPVSHVAIYLGGGLVVHASTPGRPVEISSIATMPFSGARRV